MPVELEHSAAHTAGEALNDVWMGGAASASGTLRRSWRSCMGSAAAAADEEDEEIKLLQEVEGGYGRVEEREAAVGIGDEREAGQGGG